MNTPQTSVCPGGNGALDGESRGHLGSLDGGRDPRAEPRRMSGGPLGKRRAPREKDAACSRGSAFGHCGRRRPSCSSRIFCGFSSTPHPQRLSNTLGVRRTGENALHWQVSEGGGCGQLRACVHFKTV